MKLAHYNALKLVLWMLIVAGSIPQQGKAHRCGRSYFSALVQLKTCRASVVLFNPIHPSDACCNAVKAIGQPCLCELVNGPPITGIDRSMALLLPKKCMISFEPCYLGRK